MRNPIPVLMLLAFAASPGVGPDRAPAPVGARGGRLPGGRGGLASRLHAHQPGNDTPRRPRVGALLQRPARAASRERARGSRSRARDRRPAADGPPGRFPGGGARAVRRDRVPHAPHHEHQLRPGRPLRRLRRGPGPRARDRLRRGALRAPLPAGAGSPRRDAAGAVRARPGRARHPPRRPAPGLPDSAVAPEAGGTAAARGDAGGVGAAGASGGGRVRRGVPAPARREGRREGGGAVRAARDRPPRGPGLARGLRARRRPGRGHPRARRLGRRRLLRPAVPEGPAAGRPRLRPAGRPSPR